MRKRAAFFAALIFTNHSFLLAGAELPPVISILTPYEPQPSLLTQRSLAIVHLFYVTQHLTPALRFIKKRTADSPDLEAMCAQYSVTFFSGTTIIKSNLVQKVITTIAQSHSLDAFFQLWNHIKQFKYGLTPEEKIILLDFAKLCLITYQSLLSIISHKNITLLPPISPEDLASIEQITEVFEVMEKFSLSFFLNRSSFSLPPFHATTHDFCASFALRFYLIKRLKPTFAFLQSLHEKKAHFFVTALTSLGFNKEDIIFDDPVIAGYFTKLQEQKKGAPLLKLINQFESYDFIKNPLFIKEFLVLLCLVYKDFFAQKSIIARSTETIQELHELSVEQLLALLDCMNEKYTRTPGHNHSLQHFMRQQRGHYRTISELLQEEYAVCPDAFTNLVFHRYYYIKRLDEVVKIVLRLGSQTKTMQRTSLLLKPFALVWHDFVTYKDLCDVRLIDDFTKEIAIYCHTLLHDPLQPSYTQTLQNFISKKDTPSLIKTAAYVQNDFLSDFKPSIEVNNILARLYYIKRLEPIMAKMQLLATYNALTTDCSYYAPLHDNPLAPTIKAIQQTGSFSTLFQFWSGINRYKYIQDQTADYALAQFITYLLCHTIQQRNTTPSSEFLSSKHTVSIDQLNQMPLEDILNLLDILIEELPDFLEKHEIHYGMNWKHWFKKYWLIGPLSAAAFSIKVYLMAQEKMYHAAAVAPDPST